MADSPSGTVAETKRHSGFVDFLTRLLKEKPLGVVGGIITLVLLLTGIFAGSLAPYGMNESFGIENYLHAPSPQFWLGTDNVGRDILSRVIYGARISVIIGLAGSTVATVISLVIGVASGHIGGKLDMIVYRFVDGWMSLPSLVVLMVVMSIVRGGMLPMILVLGIQWGLVGSRIIRGAVISINENAYVRATAATGCSTMRVLARHILPNIMAPAIILFTTRVPNVILVEASLSFLGFGVPPPAPSWGGMISGAGRHYMLQAPWMVVWPGIALASVVYGVNMFGDAVRDLLDPRLRGGAGRYGVKAKQQASED